MKRILLYKNDEQVGWDNKKQISLSTSLCNAAQQKTRSDSEKSSLFGGIYIYTIKNSFFKIISTETKIIIQKIMIETILCNYHGGTYK